MPQRVSCDLLTCGRANEHQRERAASALCHEGEVAWRNVRGLSRVVSARGRVVHAVGLELAQELDLQKVMIEVKEYHIQCARA